MRSVLGSGKPSKLPEISASGQKERRDRRVPQQVCLADGQGDAPSPFVRTRALQGRERLQTGHSLELFFLNRLPMQDWGHGLLGTSRLERPDSV